jgi:hypothetical protein
MRLDAPRTATKPSCGDNASPGEQLMTKLFMIEIGVAVILAVLTQVARLPNQLNLYLGLGAAAVAMHGVHHEWRVRRPRRYINAHLRALSAHGHTLLQRAGDGNPEAFKADARARAKKAEDFIKDAFGDAQAAYFMSDVGYFSHANPTKPDCPARKLIEGRLRRLNELSRMVRLLPLEDDFDPRKWMQH